MDWQVIKQARQRLAGEQGAVIKDWGGKIPIALVYPNSYRLGMSNLGFHTIYRLLNSYRDIVCERAFWEPGQTGPPVSLESQRPLSDFAAIAFSLTYEMDYFNIVPVLKAAGIPLLAADRDESQPLVIGGGAAIMANPLPVSAFFDVLGIGEAEPILTAMRPYLTESIQDKREGLLKSLATLPGVYVPLRHAGETVTRQWARLEDWPVSTSMIITPDTELGDLFLVEVQRGCARGCRFCLVSGAFRPMRFHAPKRLIPEMTAGLKFRERIGLVGPAVTAHPDIEELMENLNRMGAGISVSSLRVKPLSDRLLDCLVKGKAQTVTMAPEAGSARLRRLIKKDISEDDILAAVTKCAEHGIRQLKLYFMIGLPTETDDDIASLVSLVSQIKRNLDRRQPGSRLTVNLSPFIPKAGTPFQWLPATPAAELDHRVSRVKKQLPARGIKVNSESPAWSEVQAVLSRGDSNLGEVLSGINRLSLSAWRQSITKYRFDVDYFAFRTWDKDQELPWSFIDSGIAPQHLKEELDRALGQN